MLEEVRTLAEEEARAVVLAHSPTAGSSSPQRSSRIETETGSSTPLALLQQEAPSRPLSVAGGERELAATDRSDRSDQLFERSSTVNVSEPTSPSPFHRSQVPPSPSGWSSRSLHSVEFATDYYKAYSSF